MDGGSTRPEDRSMDWTVAVVLVALIVALMVIISTYIAAHADKK